MGAAVPAPHRRAGARPADRDAFKTKTANGLTALAGADQATRFRDAATSRAARIGEESKLEFRNKIRFYVTVFRDQTEGGREIDDTRVIVRLPGSNTVFNRDGAWPRDGGLNLKRQAEK